MYSFVISILLLPIWNWELTRDFELCFWNIITFVFFGLISINHFSHHSCSWLRQCCKPDLDFENITRSSAYDKLFIVVPFGSTSGSDKVFLNSSGISLM